MPRCVPAKTSVDPAGAVTVGRIVAALDDLGTSDRPNAPVGCLAEEATALATRIGRYEMWLAAGSATVPLMLSLMSTPSQLRHFHASHGVLATGKCSTASQYIRDGLGQ